MPRVRFEGFELDLAAGELRRHGSAIPLQPQPLRVLTLLVGRAGELVSRDEIQQTVWPGDTFVDFDQGLNYCIRQIRAALGDTAEHPRFIETLPRRGYRFRAAIESEAPRPRGRIMLVVLPFENLDPDPAQAFFSDGLTDEMIAQLGRLNPSTLGIIARTSAMRYKQSDKGIDTIGRELGVSHVLEGSVRRSDGRVRVTVRLIQVSDQTLVWADTIDRPMGDILALQRTVAAAVAGEIGVQLTPQERVRLAGSSMVHAGAYEAYLRGRYLWKQRSRVALDDSVRALLEAVALDPAYAPAWAGLADVRLTQLDYNYLRPDEAFALADRALLDALRLDNTRAEPHTTLGHLRLHQFDWGAADEAFTRAIALNPGYDTAHYYYGNLLAAMGRFEDALTEADRAVELDPMSANTRQNRLFILYLARRYQDALDEGERILALDPSYVGLHYYLGHAHERLGDYDAAMHAFETLGRRRDRSRGATVLAAIGYVHARAGRRDQGAAVLDELETRSLREYVSAYDIALLLLALGRRDEACAQLWRALDEYASFLPFADVDARLDELRGTASFESLLGRLRFPRPPAGRLGTLV